MTAPREEESSWDTLADDLGLPPATKEVARSVAQHRELSAPEEPIESPPQKVSIVEVVVPPTSDASVMFESPGHVTVSVVVHSDHTDRDEGDVVEVLDFASRSGDGSEEEGDDEEGSGDAPRGKKRRRRRRRGRRGTDGAEGTETPESGTVEADEEAPEEAPPREEVELEDAPELDDEDEDDAEPMSAVDEEMGAEVAAPKQEWNVVSWVDLVATLNRPER